MGGIFSWSKKEARPKTVEERVMSQENIKKRLYNPNFRHVFPLKESVIQQILAIPLTDFHMRLSREEVARIIVKDLGLTLGVAEGYAMVIADISEEILE